MTDESVDSREEIALVGCAKFARHSVVFELDSELSKLSLFVGVDSYMRSSVLRKSIARTFAAVSTSRDWREEINDFFLHFVNVDITYDYDTLEVWTITASQKTHEPSNNAMP